ncbi:magnesium protoporphyrin IX methyltransferase [Roseomonas sp. CECT 9278]|uniref:magnesium protoporphyrin IX methyltransferase n=1 Tax=Roseomonas sp. CECT 9278 TaxID=2845823 RepID=UPI001E322970|nr:magnesium protoporphyrin IX methyltransferase [Roseomonas sp. CECT 9278]CAH0241256.1 Magnesium-protoporphyrin O-methyltransferase [Roseomonas sp. CECT 9278]
MSGSTWQARRTQIETYFDRTASETWKRLTSDAPVSGIRATVRAGRDAMRATLLSWLPDDMRGLRLLDAGCGTGALAVEAAHRGAQVVAIDVSRSLIQVARERAGTAAGAIRFEVGDMLDPYLGDFDHVVAMDSLIHYRAPDAVRALAGLAARTRGSMLFTFAPRTPLLAAMHTVGRIFPRGDRAPAIEPVAEAALRRLIQGERALAGFAPRQTRRIASGFYTSQAMELAAR